MADLIVKWEKIPGEKRRYELKNYDSQGNFINDAEQILILIPSAKKDKYHIIIEDTVVPTDVTPLMFIEKEKVIEILGFNPWNN